MNRVYLIIFILYFLLFANFSRVFAESSYVLPYPSAMPESIFYNLNLIKEKVLKYWYFGDFGQFKFNLKESDKYLVEAKTLFDYKQYLLAHQALKKSDDYFKKVEPAILSAERNGKNTEDKEQILRNAAEKHIEELTKIKSTVPSVFQWTPERERPTTLKLSESLDTSIKLRQKRL